MTFGYESVQTTNRLPTSLQQSIGGHVPIKVGHELSLALPHTNSRGSAVRGWCDKERSLTLLYRSLLLFLYRNKTVLNYNILRGSSRSQPISIFRPSYTRAPSCKVPSYTGVTTVPTAFSISSVSSLKCASGGVSGHQNCVPSSHWTPPRQNTFC